MKRRRRRGTARVASHAKGRCVDDALSEADGRGVGRIIDGQTDVPHPNTYGTYDVELLLQWGVIFAMLAWPAYRYHGTVVANNQHDT